MVIWVMYHEFIHLVQDMNYNLNGVFLMAEGIDAFNIQKKKITSLILTFIHPTHHIYTHPHTQIISTLAEDCF